MIHAPSSSTSTPIANPDARAGGAGAPGMNFSEFFQLAGGVAGVPTRVDLRPELILGTGPGLVAQETRDTLQGTGETVRPENASDISVADQARDSLQAVVADNPLTQPGAATPGADAKRAGAESRAEPNGRDTTGPRGEPQLHSNPSRSAPTSGDASDADGESSGATSTRETAAERGPGTTVTDANGARASAAVSASPGATASAAASSAAHGGASLGVGLGAAGATHTASLPGATSVSAVGGANATTDAIERGTHAKQSSSPARAEPEQKVFQTQVVRGLASLLRTKGGSLNLELNPRSLGAIRVRLEMNEGTVSATLRPTTESAHRLLTESQAVLHDALEARGLVVERLTVEPWAEDDGRSPAGQSSDRAARDAPQHGTERPNDPGWSPERESLGKQGRDRGGDPHAARDGTPEDPAHHDGADPERGARSERELGGVHAGWIGLDAIA